MELNQRAVGDQVGPTVFLHSNSRFRICRVGIAIFIGDAAGDDGLRNQSDNRRRILVGGKADAERQASRPVGTRKLQTPGLNHAAAITLRTVESSKEI
jgi:hypothetical protein